MNLYRIEIEVSGPKFSEYGTLEYVLAKDDECMYIYIEENYRYGDWYDLAEEEFNTEKEFKKEILENKGDYGLEYSGDEFYYGVNKYQWELIKEDVKTEDLGIFKDIVKVI